MSDKETKKDDFSKIREKHRVRKTISSLLLAFAVLYLPIVLIASGGARAEISLLTIGTISDSIEAEGLLLKEENILFLPFEGTYTQSVSEGERIPAGSTIATVVEDAYASKLRELENLANEILLRKKEGGLSSGIFTRDLKQIEEELSDNIGEIASLVATGRLDDLAYFEEEITRLESARDEIVAGSMTTDQYTEDLQRQYDVLSVSLMGKVTEIKASQPGYISFEIDGYEGTMTEEIIRGFSAEEARMAIKQFGRDSSDDNTDSPFAKLITGNSYTLVAVIDDSDADRMRGFANFELTIEKPDLSFGTNEVEFGVSQGGKTVIYIKVNKKLGELASARRINFSIQLYEYSGLMVPIRSLLNYEAYPIREVELARVKDNWIQFMSVEVLAANKTHAIIRPVEETLNLFDYYAVNPKRVEEGQVVR
ncbi:MAG: hypothetical protein JXN10_06600 [Clostridia bacterium]|nr:hypothetical protein [Clostridia bacterium]MBN2883180.1 hypothetical protein [Clostridia bacterium]